MKTLHDLKALGYSFTLEGENIRLKYLGRGEQPTEAQPFIQALKDHKAEAVEYLKAQRPLPYLDADGALVIPFGCDPKYHWWSGGQLSCKIAEEIGTWLH